MKKLISLLILLAFSLSINANTNIKEDAIAYSCSSPRNVYDKTRTGDWVEFYAIKVANKDEWFLSIGKAGFGTFGLGDYRAVWSKPITAEANFSPVADKRCVDCLQVTFHGRSDEGQFSLNMAEYYDSGWGAQGGGLLSSLELKGSYHEFFGTCSIAHIDYDLDWTRTEEKLVMIRELLKLTNR